MSTPGSSPAPGRTPAGPVAGDGTPGRTPAGRVAAGEASRTPAGRVAAGEASRTPAGRVAEPLGEAYRDPATDETQRLIAAYVLGLADDALIYAQRLGEWIASSPQIEEDMALGNIGLDLLGQARALLTHVGRLDGTGRDEDRLAYFRDEREFRSVHLVEQPKGDFADEMARLLWFSAYAGELYGVLVDSTDEVVAGVARKAVKEVAYHRDHAEHWVVRLGDGTDESHRRMTAALQRVQPYVDELFEDDDPARAAAQAGVGVLPSRLRSGATRFVRQVLAEATLQPPEEPRHHTRGGRRGVHSTAMGFLLAELQHIRRSHPEATQW